MMTYLVEWITGRFTEQSRLLSTLKKKSCLKQLEKEKMPETHFPMFSTLPKTNFSFSFTTISADAFNLNQSRNLSFGKALNPPTQIMAYIFRMS